MKQFTEYITINQQVAFGKPTIKGTRYTVDFVVEQLAGGNSVETLARKYPKLTKEAIQAALSYAAARLRDERIYLVEDLPDDPFPEHQTTHG